MNNLDSMSVVQPSVAPHNSDGLHKSDSTSPTPQVRRVEGGGWVYTGDHCTGIDGALRMTQHHSAAASQKGESHV